MHDAIDLPPDVQSCHELIRAQAKQLAEQSRLQAEHLTKTAHPRWTMPIRRWKEALNHFAIMFEGRMPDTYSN